MNSLQKNYQFDIVYKRGKSLVNKHFVMYVLPNKKNENYYGLSVSKKLGKAVKRNRTRRLIKECLRLEESFIKKGYDVVVIARESARGIDFYETKKSINNLIRRHGMAL